ncbi:MAG: hypothetical protein WBF17_18390 [Phycisphaerae bacterium]
MVGSSTPTVSHLVRVSMPAGVPNDADDIFLPGQPGGIHYVADDHGLGREISHTCVVRPNVLAKQAAR